jgi:hypothetical protein
MNPSFGARSVSHVVHVVGNHAGRSPDAAVAEQDDLAILRYPVD